MTLNKTKFNMTKNMTRIEPFLYLLPFFIGIIIFTLYPVINVFLLSFKDDYSYLRNTFSSWNFENYKAVLTDPKFAQSMINTVLYVIFVVPISTALSYFVSYLMIHLMSTFSLIAFSSFCIKNKTTFFFN